MVNEENKVNEEIKINFKKRCRRTVKMAEE